jgi:hypothetical protein
MSRAQWLHQGKNFMSGLTIEYTAICPAVYLVPLLFSTRNRITNQPKEKGLRVSRVSSPAPPPTRTFSRRY